MQKFLYFLGIDQTGASLSQGKRAKPLKTCLLRREGKKWCAFTRKKGKALTLDALSPSAIEKLFKDFELDLPKNRMAILADCVLGMPLSAWPKKSIPKDASHLWNLFKDSSTYHLNGALFGRAVSESFFSRFPIKQSSIPKRKCEIISGSNSLFTTRPFQKNIQTGSYRIWRDLVSEGTLPWLNLWPFNSKQNFNSDLPWLFEGYPSLFWRELLKLNQRHPGLLISKLKTDPLFKQVRFDSISSLKSDPDLCDATVLALGGLILQDRNELFAPFPTFWGTENLQFEGWICGLKHP